MTFFFYPKCNILSLIIFTALIFVVKFTEVKNMNIKLKLILLSLFFCSRILLSQQIGELKLVNIDAPSLKFSIIGEPIVQPIAIYLPPSYKSQIQKRYPVVYFLPGFDETLDYYMNVNENGYCFESSMNSNITQGRLKEVIMVLVNGFSKLHGSFFYNSSVTGNWEDFVVKDVVDYMDATYRTIPQSGSRALMGFSMGGYGAMHISMRHPSIFSIGIGECPGLATNAGMFETSLFDDANRIKNVISIKNTLSTLSRPDAHEKYLEIIDSLKLKADWMMLFSLAYGSAFAPDPKLNAPYFKYPFTLDLDNNLVRDSAVFETYKNGFGNLREKVELYKDSLLMLKEYVIDYGTNDYFQWIHKGCRYYDSLLILNKIPHKFYMNNGGHGDLHKILTEYHELPLCDSVLNFDTAHLSGRAYIEGFSCDGLATKPIIDTVHKVVSISFKIGTGLKFVKPTIYLSPGAKIIPTENAYVDLSKHKLKYTVIAEDGKRKANWIINTRTSSK
jgi:S-formylglutathione hydrolase